MNKLQKLIIVFFLFLLSFSSYSQLNNFTLTVTKADETCTGNGSLTFNVQNTTSGATILYSVYLFPNLTTPLSVLTTNTFAGLSSGNYRVVALQSIGNLSNSQQQDIQINNLVVPLSYQIVGTNVNCQGNGSITVNVTQGNVATYEIISGPIIFAPQTSNVFSNLPIGTYNVRVNDVCGEGVVLTHTVLNPSLVSNLNIYEDEQSINCLLVDCNTISYDFSVYSNLNTTILYPLTIQFTSFPPSGGLPVVITQTIISGDSEVLPVFIGVPFYNGLLSNYTIKVTNGCGIFITKNGVLFRNLSLLLKKQNPNECFKKIKIELCNFLPPYTVEFVSSPAGFNPLDFNSNHPGPFTNPIITYTESATTNMPDGNYVIKITDACGRIIQSQIDISESLPDYVVVPSDDPCYPIYTVFIPNNGPKVTAIIITDAPPQLNFTFPYDVSSSIDNGNFEFVLTQPGPYTFTGTNVCGDTFIFVAEIPPLELPKLLITGADSEGCGGSVSISTDDELSILFSVVLIEAPSNYGFSLPHDVSQYILQPSSENFLLENLPEGGYTFIVTDSCGNEYVLSTLVPPVVSSLEVYFLRGCEAGSSSLYFSSLNGGLVAVTITAAPSSFTPTLPYDVSFNITIDKNFSMNSLPPGSYTFHTTDVCGFELDTTIVMPDYIVIDEISIQPNCGSFNIVMNYFVNEPDPHTYWLQKLNPITNLWEHPLTGVVFPNGMLPNLFNSYQLIVETTNYNIASSGTFRILKRHFIFSNGIEALTDCLEVIKVFDYNGDLRIISATTFPCSDGSNEVHIIALGVPPLTYKITTKDGLPFIVNNGNSNIFSGLAPAVYNFQVQDVCGNIVNRLFDINSLPEPTIIPSNLCDGQTGQLSVQAISFLSYQWWKGTNTSTILSTTNVLTFNPFSTVTTPGTYYVRMYSQSALSCVDKTISFVVPTTSNPNAGDDATITICGSTDSINLFSILVAPFDTNGVWEETTSSGVLNGNIWLPIGIPYGTYAFNYTVVGFCNDIDIATITISFNQGPSTPIIANIPEICSGDTINLFVASIANASYNWTGPNNFTATTQNSVIPNCTDANSGIYTVTAFLNGCIKKSFIEIIVKPTPNFTIDAKCLNGVYTITVLADDNSFDPNLVSYLWTGPNGYSNTTNTIYLAGYPAGIYSVTVTNLENCSVTNSINVVTTLCSIPNVITPNNDGNNDYFDLSGLDVERLEIFSRWGRLVYEADNYINQWHGQNRNGGRLPDSTYYYFIYLRNGDQKRGWLLVAANSK